MRLFLGFPTGQVSISKIGSPYIPDDEALQTKALVLELLNRRC